MSNSRIYALWTTSRSWWRSMRPPRCQRPPNLLSAGCAPLDAHETGATIHGEEHAVGDGGGADAGLHHTRQPVLARDDGAVTQDSARVRHDGADQREERRPGGH